MFHCSFFPLLLYAPRVYVRGVTVAILRVYKLLYPWRVNAQQVPTTGVHVPVVQEVLTPETGAYHHNVVLAYKLKYKCCQIIR